MSKPDVLILTFRFIAAPAAVALATTPVHGAPACRPILQFESAQLSPMRLPTLERIWTARLAVDASRCATKTGRFEIGFLQLKETAPDIGFHAAFAWTAPATEISFVFAPDEAVADYWLYIVEACPCRD
jgi:hypothetical protein